MGTTQDSLNTRATSPLHVAYVMSRFPVLTETFVLYEMLELERQGIEVSIYPLRPEHAPVRHPEVERLAPRVHHQALLSFAVLAAHAQFFVKGPWRYVRTLTGALASTWGSGKLFFGGLACLPKSVWLAREFERRGIGHVHAHFANHPALIASVVHGLTGISYSFTAHGSDLHIAQQGLARKVRAAAFVVAVSDYNRRFILEHTGDEYAAKVHVVHCGVDSRLVPATERQRGERGHAAQPLRIVCVAALRAVKGHRHLIDACRLLAERGLAFECHLVGKGPERERIEAQVRAAELTQHVRLHGELAREGVLEQLAAADVAVLASITDSAGRREGIPVALMEAMACGLPVVASDLSGIPELVKHQVQGLLAPPGDARALADALERLAREPGLRGQLGSAGRDKVVREFDLRATSAQLREHIVAGASARR